MDQKFQKVFNHWGEKKFKKGFLHKEFNIKALIFEDVTPTLDELLMFKPLVLEGDQESSDDERINTLITKQKRASGIVKGDKVRIAKGELKGMTATVVSVSDTLVTVTPKSKEITGSLQFSVGDVEKYFQPGDYVRVVHGKLQGECGLVTSTEDNYVHIYSEAKGQEVIP